MKAVNVPSRDQVSPANQAIFDNLQKNIGMVPNLFATMALSENALGTYLAFSGARSSLKNKEKEVVNLVVSQVNECAYCSSAHTQFAKMNGFTDDQVLEIRSGSVSFDAKLDALAKLARAAALNKGNVDDAVLENFYAAGYTRENLVDTVMLIGDKTITNYLYALTHIPVDFPAVPALENQPA